MKSDDDEILRLRRSLMETASTDRESGAVDPQRIWQAVDGKLSPEEVAGIVDDVTASPEAVEAWELARELHSQVSQADCAKNVVRHPRAFRLTWAAGLAAAAVVVIGVGVPLMRQSTTTGMEVYRGHEDTIGKSLLTDGEALPRSQFLLRWSPGPEGTTYDIVVTNEKLDPLLRSTGLEDPELLVPELSLKPVRGGGTVLWQVKVLLPDGAGHRSATYFQRVLARPSHQ